MKGDIIVIGTGLMVSNNVVLDYHTDVIDTPSGQQAKRTSVFEINEPYGSLEAGEHVEIAFKAEDGNKFSYRGIVQRFTPLRCVINIVELTENYKEIVRRAKAWRV